MIAPFASHRPRRWVKKKRVCSKALHKMNCGSMTVLFANDGLKGFEGLMIWAFQIAMKLVLKTGWLVGVQYSNLVSWYIPRKSTKYLRYLVDHFQLNLALSQSPDLPSQSTTKRKPIRRAAKTADFLIFLRLTAQTHHLLHQKTYFFFYTSTLYFVTKPPEPWFQATVKSIHPHVRNKV